MSITGTLTKNVLTFSLGAAVAFAQAAGTPQAGQASSAAAGAQATPTPQSGEKKSEPHGQGAHSADHGMSTNKGAGVMVGKTDQDFMIKAAQGGNAEVEMTRLAQEKATSSEVKEFARKLEQDHTKANEQLKQLAAQKNVDLPTDMGKHAAKVEKFKNLSGDKFDKEFMKAQVSHHKKDVNEFQKHSDRSMDSDVKAFASATLPTLQEHLKQAEQLQQSTRGRSVDSNTSRDSAKPSTTTPNASDSSAKPQGDNNPAPAK